MGEVFTAEGLRLILPGVPDGAQEIAERRTQHAKVFDCGNGVRQAVISGAAIHRRVSGVWVPRAPGIVMAAAGEYTPDIDANGYADGNSTSYATARDVAAGCDAANITVGQQQFGGWYTVWRGFLRFDCTGILGVSETVYSVTLTMAAAADISTTFDFDVDIIQCALAVPFCDHSADNFTAVQGGTKDVTWRNTSGMSINTYYTSPNMDNTYPEYSSGYTYYGLRSSRDGTAPNGNEYIALDPKGDDQPPYLTIVIISRSGCILTF